MPKGSSKSKTCPPGNYRLAGWHEKLQPEEREITVRDNAAENFTLKEKMKRPTS